MTGRAALRWLEDLVARRAVPTGEGRAIIPGTQAALARATGLKSAGTVAAYLRDLDDIVLERRGGRLVVDLDALASARRRHEHAADGPDRQRCARLAALTARAATRVLATIDGRNGSA